MNNYKKYKPFQPVTLPDRKWPSQTIDRAPIWCSVDLRDGNQALPDPMDVETKLRFFDLLLKIGFKEIEAGFPAASEIEFDFVRRLIEEKNVPRGVKIQVLCQCRPDLIKRTLESLRGAKDVIFHLYNSTSPSQRKHVFNASREKIIEIAVQAVDFLKKNSEPLMKEGTRMQFEYSPESFSSTELDFSLKICERVTDAWQPTPDNPIILNLPATVEYATPNVHADQIEWMARHISRKDRTILSVHTHNDRGTGVAATELALLAGAQRVEGTLFGNGERTGNLDIVTVALNMHTQGIDPKLDFSNLPKIRSVYEECTRIKVHERHPYAGDLVFTAFSGSHQDAIKKSWAAQRDNAPWDVLYIPINPKDIGREYEPVVRFNSQSGKGGAAFIMEQSFGLRIPKAMQPEFGAFVGKIADQEKRELSPMSLFNAFSREYAEQPCAIENLHIDDVEGDNVSCAAEIRCHGNATRIKGAGNGSLDAFCKAVQAWGVSPFEIVEYAEHSIENNTQARAVCYIRIKTHTGELFWGAAIHAHSQLAPLLAVLSSLHRAKMLPLSAQNRHAG